MTVRIAALGAYVPPDVLTNADLEKMVETSDQWITERTGIKERHIANDQCFTSDMACAAALKALERAHVAPEEVDLILVATTTPDYVFPSTACLVQAKLNAIAATAMDIQAACTGFVYGLEVAFSMMKGSDRYRNVLVIGAEKLSSITDWTDRNTCVLFGDGAGCALLQQVDDDSAPDALIGCRTGANGTYADLLTLPAGGVRHVASHQTVDAHEHFIHMAGPEVFKLAVISMGKVCKYVLKQTGIDPHEIRWVIPHQANLRIINAVASKLDIDIEKQLYVCVSRYGNTSAASIPIALNELFEEGKLARGDKLLLTAFGAGMTYGAILLQY